MREVMGIKETIKRLLQEADLYKKHGLLDEARGKYTEAEQKIREHEKIQNKEKILKSIANKIRLLDSDTQRVEKGPSSPELSEKAQNLIQNLFSFSKSDSKEEAILEGAIALAKFGQFERALGEFNKLLDKESHRVMAAKNVLRCHIQLNSEDAAIDQYEDWVSKENFLPGQLEKVRLFLVEILKNKGIQRELTSVSIKEELVQEPEEEEEEEFIDISSIGIYFNFGPEKGKVVEFDVNFQSGNMLSLIISKNDAKTIEPMKEGDVLKELQFFSPIAMFNGSGTVSAKSQIKSGPKQGDFCLDIKITSK
jgi:tetratricopeptide (TPR) repeat protein